MLADKALDAGTLVGLAAVLAPAVLFGAASGVARSAWIFAAVGAVVAAAGVVTKRRWPAAFTAAGRYAHAARRALSSLGSPPRLLGGVALAVASWLAEAASMLLLSSGLGVHLSLGQSLVGLLVLNLGIALPVSVANVGVYEGTLALALAPFGVPAAQGLALGLLHHSAQLAGVGLFALFFWLRDRVARASILPAPLRPRTLEGELSSP